MLGAIAVSLLRMKEVFVIISMNLKRSGWLYPKLYILVKIRVARHVLAIRGSYTESHSDSNGLWETTREIDHFPWNLNIYLVHAVSEREFTKLHQQKTRKA